MSIRGGALDARLAEAYAALSVVEKALARPVNPTLVSLTDWRRRGEYRYHFLNSVAASPKLFVLGSEDDLASQATSRARERRRSHMAPFRE